MLRRRQTTETTELSTRRTGSLALALLLLGASTADAIGIRHQVRGGEWVGSSIVIDVFLDTADVPDLLEVSVAVNVDENVFAYNGAASQALPIIHPAPIPEYGTNGNQPGYLFYTPGTMSGQPASALYPASDPHQEFGGEQPAGIQQINVEFDPRGPYPVEYGADDVWIAALVFDVVEWFPSTEISLSLSAGGTRVSRVPPGSRAEDISDQVVLSEPLTVLAPPVTDALAIVPVRDDRAIAVAYRTGSQESASPSPPFSDFDALVFDGAAQTSSIEMTGMSGYGWSGVDGAGDQSGSSVFDLTFQVNEPADYELTGTVDIDPPAEAYVALLGPAGPLYEPDLRQPILDSGTLESGVDYRLVMAVSHPDDMGFAAGFWSFSFDLAAVPEPRPGVLAGTVILVLAALRRGRPGR